MTATIPAHFIHRLRRPPQLHRRHGVGDAACGPGAFQDPADPWLTDASGNSTTPRCVLNTVSQKVYTQIGISPDIASQLPPGFNPSAPAMPGAVSVAQWMSDPSQVGGCPVIDPSKNMCAALNPDGSLSTIGCNAYRECDSLQGPISAAGGNPFGTLNLGPHIEYGLPGGPTGNVGFGAPSSGNVPLTAPAAVPTSALYAIAEGNPQTSPKSATTPGGSAVPTVFAGGSPGSGPASATFNASGQPTTQQLAAAAWPNTVPAATVNGGASILTSAGFGGIPMWALLGGAVLILFLLMGKK